VGVHACEAWEALPRLGASNVPLCAAPILLEPWTGDAGPRREPGVALSSAARGACPCDPGMVGVARQVQSIEAMEHGADGTLALSPLERRERLYWLIIERVAEALREGGMLVVVFGLLDYYLGEGRQDTAWPWKCAACGSIVWLVGVVAEWASSEVKRQWTER
jgi:hypothetical protein